LAQPVIAESGGNSNRQKSQSGAKQKYTPIPKDVHEKLQQYSQILSQYREALNLYQLHKEEFQLHSDQYHRYSKLEDAIEQPLVVPNLKKLKVYAQDACMQLQLLEAQLQVAERQLVGAVQSLIASRANMSQDAFMTRWSQTQQLALS